MRYSPACVVMDVLQNRISKKRRFRPAENHGMFQVDVKRISQRNKSQTHKNIQSHSAAHPQSSSQSNENFINAIQSLGT